MAEIKLYDYTVTDDWGWCEFLCIGQGNLSANNVVALIEAVPEDEEIIVKINSVGGFVFDGWAIYNALKAHKANVTVRIDGLAASIASIIAMAGDQIIIAQAAMLMIHKPTVDGFWMGSMDAEALKKEAAALDQIQSVLNEIYKSKTGLEADVIDSMINAETWITPSQAVTLGFANSIANTITEEVETVMPQNAFNHIFKNADAPTRAYANRTIKINNKMNVQEVLNKQNETQARTNTLLEDLGKFFKNLVAPKNEGDQPTNAESDLKDGGKIYYDGVLGVGTEVFTDADMTTHPAAGDHDLADGNFITVDDAGLVTVMEKRDVATDDSEDVANLKNEIETLKAEKAKLLEATNALTTSLNAANEGLAKIKNIKSTYEPDGREKEISRNTKVENNGNKTMADIEARREERKNLKNKK